jgi:hypothetical protein
MERQHIATHLEDTADHIADMPFDIVQMLLRQAAIMLRDVDSRGSDARDNVTAGSRPADVLEVLQL